MVRRWVTGQDGVTLTELLIVGLLSGIVFMGATMMYTGSLRQYGTLRNSMLNIDPRATIEELAKKIAPANEFQLKNPSGTHSLGLWVRVDAAVDANGSLTRRDTPVTLSDDAWIKYRFFTTDNTLRWRWDPSDGTGEPTGGDVAATDTLLIPNVRTSGSPISEFKSIPNGDGDPTHDRVVGIRVAMLTSGSWAQPNDVYTEVGFGAKSSR